jgi:hypothetical protein
MYWRTLGAYLSNADGNLANHAMNRDRLIFVLALSDLWLLSRCDYCC